MGEASVRATQLERDAEARAAEVSARAKRESEKEIARLAVLAAEKVLANPTSHKASSGAGKA
jgi:hypothetical protein